MSTKFMKNSDEAQPKRQFCKHFVLQTKKSINVNIIFFLANGSCRKTIDIKVIQTAMTITSGEEKAERSKCAPEWARALPVSF